MKDKQVIIIGAGGHAAEIRDYIRHFNQSQLEERILVMGYLDDNKDNYVHYEYKEPYLGAIEDHKVNKNKLYLMGIANLAYRKPIIEKFLKLGAVFTGLIHPTALVSPTAQVGKGVVISHNVSIGPKARIGDYTILNSRCTIGHDSIIGKYNFISPQVAISGNTKIGMGNMLGTNTCTIPSIKIGDNNKVAAGMVIYKEVGNNETVLFRHKERLIIRETKKKNKLSNKIYLSAPHMGGAEQSYIKDAFDTNWISTIGPQINSFEGILARYTQVSSVAALASGTSAIHLALKLLGVGQGDTVLTQSFTFAASAFPITYLGAKPIFVDSERDSWNMDPNLLEDALKQIKKSNGKQLPKAIIPVHLYGMPANMEEINAVAGQYGIPVIEDAAEALGSTYQQKPCGSWSDLGILSFNGNKIITTSGGGALLSNNKEYIEKAKFLATQARDNAPHYEHTQVGYNYRLGNVNAAIGLGQMEVLDERVKRKREIFNFYKTAFSKAQDISFQPEQQSSFSNRWLTTILTKSFEQREKIRLALENENIESRPLWKPMHLQPVFKEAQYYGGNVAEDMFNRGLCLPSGTAMTEEDLERIIEVINL